MRVGWRAKLGVATAHATARRSAAVASSSRGALDGSGAVVAEGAEVRGEGRMEGPLGAAMIHGTARGSAAVASSSRGALDGGGAGVAEGTEVRGEGRVEGTLGAVTAHTTARGSAAAASSSRGAPFAPVAAAPCANALSRGALRDLRPVIIPLYNSDGGQR